MLVWDSFRGHLSVLIRSTLKSLNTETAVIPGGMTSMVQPLDVAINKPFKDRMRNKWQEWMCHRSVSVSSNVSADSCGTSSSFPDFGELTENVDHMTVFKQNYWHPTNQSINLFNLIN